MMMIKIFSEERFLYFYFKESSGKYRRLKPPVNSNDTASNERDRETYWSVKGAWLGICVYVLAGSNLLRTQHMLNPLPCASPDFLTGGKGINHLSLRPYPRPSVEYPSSTPDMLSLGLGAFNSCGVLTPVETQTFCLGWAPADSSQIQVMSGSLFKP